MQLENRYLLIIEATEGLNTHAVYPTVEEAKKASDTAFKKQQEPICIYDLKEGKYVWQNEEFPPYGETIANHIIQSYRK